MSTLDKNSTDSRLNRREFLKTSSTVGASLLIGFNAQGLLAATDSADAAMQTMDFNPFIKIADDGGVTIVAKHFEMGQGTTTGLTTLIAEEMDLDWDQITVEFAPSDNERYKNFAFDSQGTGGSTAIANSFIQYRQAGASAREMLVRAAADTFGVSVDEVSVKTGAFTAADKTLAIADIVGAASKLTPTENPALKSASEFNLIGTENLPRKDSFAKTNGTAKFAMDVKVANMLYVTILRSPKFGGTLKSFDAAAAADVKGYVDARALSNNAGVAVYATSTWSAIKARKALTAEWDDANADSRGSDAMQSEYQALLDADPVFDATHKGDFAEVAAMVDAAPTTVQADFTFPLLAHAPMEPLNCVIEPTENGVRLHDGCQIPSITHPTLAAILGIDAANIEIATYYAGGSFGRRANAVSDYHAEAALAFVAMEGKKAVKLVWTREDDLAGGFYRPMVAHRAKIAIGDDGKIAGWAHRTAAQSIFKGTPFEPMIVKEGVDHSSIEGIADTPYSIENLSVGLSDYESPMPVLWWRSVGHSHSGYTMEVLMDMAAEAAEQDPVAFRLAHLDESDPDQARFAGVLKLAAEKSGWGDQPGEGKGRGVAVHKSFNTYVAEVAEVSVNDEGAISIDKITCAVDCGTAVNPDIIRAQMEGGIGYGIGAVMRNEVTMSDGVVDQANFPQYQPIRISDMPDIEVHIMASQEDPSGVGEPGLPPAGPALANAIYAATGNRVTQLPLAKNGVKFA